MEFNNTRKNNYALLKKLGVVKYDHPPNLQCF